MARDTNELADILNYRLREHLGATVDYRAYLLPNELAMGVEMLSPPLLRGFHFIFRENELLPIEVRSYRDRLTIPTNLTPPPLPTTFPTLNPNLTAIVDRMGNWMTNITYPTLGIDGVTEMATTGGTTATNAPAPVIGAVRVRTQAEEIAFRNYDSRHARGDILQPAQWEEYQRLLTMQPYGTPVPAARVRTPEQEARFQLLQEEGNHRLWTPLENEEMMRLRQLAACPTPPPPPAPRIHVRVHREDSTYGNQWNVTVKVGTVSRDLPSIAVIKSLLPPADKHFLPSRQGRHRSTLWILRIALNAGLPAQSLHDALRAWVMATENAITTAESTTGAVDPQTANLLRAQPATLEVGGMIYRLVPTHQTDVRPLITRVRARIIASTQVEAEAIRARATADARVVVSEGERAANRLREEAQLALRAAGSRVPDWVRDSRRPHFWDGTSWRVEMRVSCLLTEIRLTVSPWNRILYWNPILKHDANWFAMAENKFPLWVTLGPEGTYSLYSVQAAMGTMTHIDHDRACMSLQALPSRISGLNELKALESAIGRGVMIVNLNSPLAWDTERYFPAFREQLPSTVVKFLNREFRLLNNEGNRITLENAGTLARFRESWPQYPWDRDTSITADGEGVFRVEDAPVPITPTVALNPIILEDENA